MGFPKSEAITPMQICLKNQDKSLSYSMKRIYLQVIKIRTMKPKLKCLKHNTLRY
jgi:hypothetical protein